MELSTITLVSRIILYARAEEKKKSKAQGSVKVDMVEDIDIEGCIKNTTNNCAFNYSSIKTKVFDLSSWCFLTMYAFSDLQCCALLMNSLYIRTLL